MPNTAITKNELTKFRTGAELTQTAATVDTAGDTETFEFATNGMPFLLIADVAATNGSVSLEVVKGNLWSGATKSVTAEQNKKTMFYVEAAYGARKDGKLYIKATPATGKKLKTDHALKLSVVEIQL
jgi:hypothetical protein